MTVGSTWRAALERTLAELPHATQLPRESFVAREAFEMDARLHWASWLPVCHTSELQAPGAFSVLEVFGERILIVRGADLELAAWFDRCAHRGTPLTVGERGHIERLELVCPYHGLAYDLRGRALEPHAERLGLSGRSLDRALVAERFGFVFAAARAPMRPLAEEPAPAWLERASMHALRLARRSRYDVGANWKLCVQNFQESHHFASVHPSLERRTPLARSTSHDFGGRFLGGSMEIAEGSETVSESGLLGGRPLIAAAEDARIVRDAHLFPGWMTSLQPDYFLSYRLLPKAVDVTTVVADIYLHAAAPEAGRQDLYGFWDRTNAEDKAICERQQRGIQSPSYQPGGYAPSEDGMHAFDRLVARAYLEKDAPK